MPTRRLSRPGKVKRESAWPAIAAGMKHQRLDTDIELMLQHDLSSAGYTERFDDEDDWYGFGVPLMRSEPMLPTSTVISHPIMMIKVEKWDLKRALGIPRLFATINKLTGAIE